MGMVKMLEWYVHKVSISNCECKFVALVVNLFIVVINRETGLPQTCIQDRCRLPIIQTFQHKPGSSSVKR